MKIKKTKIVKGRKRAFKKAKIIPKLSKKTIVTRIKVVGVGGAGGSAIQRMVKAKVKGVEYIAINTDIQALRSLQGPIKKIRIGRKLTKGLGAGMNPEIGRAAAEEDMDKIKECLKGADMIFITAGLGGGTGSGASPVIADIAKKLKALTVAVVTKPFVFEGMQRRQIAEQAIKKLNNRVDTLITISNGRILQVIEKSTPILAAFEIADDVLREAIQGIADLLNIPGLINIDFADVRAIMEGAGTTLLGIGTANGDNRAIRAAKHAWDNPLLDLSIKKGAKGVIFIVSGSSDLQMNEVNEIAQIITDQADPNAKIIFGTVIDDRLKDKIKVTLIATGFNQLKQAPLAEIAKPVDVVFKPFSDAQNEKSEKDNIVEINKEQAKKSENKFKFSIKKQGKKKIAKKTKIDDEKKDKFDDNVQNINNDKYLDDELDIPAFLRKRLM